MTNNQAPQDDVRVEQCDREAAASVIGFHGRQTGVDKNIIAGQRDYHPLVQAFARHRRSAQASAVGMREALERVGATIDAAERIVNVSPYWDENSRYAAKALLDYPRSQIKAEIAALANAQPGDVG